MLQGVVIFFGLIAVILCLLHYSIHSGRKAQLLNKIPGPYVWPVIGSIVTYMVPPDQLWSRMREMNKKYYPIQRVWTFIIPSVHTYHPDDVKAILMSSVCIDKSLPYKFSHPWLGTGLLTSGGKKWHQRRKILTPAFHVSVLQQFVGIFIEQSDQLVKSLCPDGEEVVDDLVSLLHKYTLNSICESAMGSTSSVGAGVLNEYRSCVSEMGELMVYRLLRPWLYLDWSFKLCKRYADQCRALKVLHRFSTSIINERKQYHEDTDGQYLKGLDVDNSTYDFDEDYGNGKRRLAMLDLLISASQKGANIDDQGIREEVDTFVFEGHDTTAMGLCFLLLLLAENKEIQEKARVEVDELYGKQAVEKFSIRDLHSLTYLERCIKESLRLFPPVPLISRYISEDLQLKKYLVPGGTTAAVFIWDLHRDPNFWPNPTVFDPDRFLPEQAMGRHPFAYVPFSAGPRNCIGQKFAMIEMKALVANILHKFYLVPIDLSSEVRFMPDMTLRPLDPIRIKFIPRS